MLTKDKIFVGLLIGVAITFVGFLIVPAIKSNSVDLEPIVVKLNEINDNILSQQNEEEIDDTLGYSLNSLYTTSLAVSHNSTTSSFRVTSSKVPSGEELNPSFPAYLMVNGVEIIECWEFTTSTTQNWWGNCNRGLSLTSSATSTVSGNSYPHGAGESIAMTNVHFIFERFVDLDSNQTISGTKTQATSTLYNPDTGLKFTGTSTIGFIRDIGGYLSWSDPIAPSNSFTFAAGSSGLTCGKGCTIASSVIGVDETQYIQTLNASSTIWGQAGGVDPIAWLNTSGNFGASGTIYVGATGTFYGTGADLIVSGLSTSTFAGNLTITGSVGIGSVASTTFAFNNNSVDWGGYGGAWKDIMASGTIYGAGLNMDGNVDIGNAYADTLTILSVIDSNLYSSSSLLLTGNATTSHLYPWANNTYDLGYYEYAWKNIYASGTLYVGDTGATSTIMSGLETGVLNVTTSTATSTFANGISLADGCYAVDGTCVAGSETPSWEYISQDAVVGLDGTYGVMTVPAGTKAIKIRAGYHTDNKIQAGISEIVISGENEGFTASSSIQVGGNQNFYVEFQWNPDDLTAFTVFGPSVGGANEQFAATTTFFR